MRISSISIGSRRSADANGFHPKGVTIDKRLGSRTGAASLTVEPKGTGWKPEGLDEIRIRRPGGLSNTEEVVFGGYVTGVDAVLEGARVTAYHVRAVDWSARLDGAVIAAETTHAAVSDLSIAQSLLAETAGENGGITAPSAVASVVLASVEEFVTEDETLRAALTRLAESSGAQWYVDAAKQLRWFAPVHVLAPFALDPEMTAAASLPSSVAGTPVPAAVRAEDAKFYSAESWSETLEKPVNKITFRGAVDQYGTELKAEHSDAASIAANGTWHEFLTDRTVKTLAAAEQRCTLEFLRRAAPQLKATITTEAETSAGLSLEPGQTVLLRNPAREQGWRWLTVQSVRQQQDRRAGVSVYTVDLGAPVSDFERALQLLKYLNENRALGAKSVVPPFWTVDTPPASLADVRLLPADSVRSYPASALNRPSNYPGIALSAGSARKAVDSNNGRWSASFAGGTQEAADWGGGNFVSDGTTLWGFRRAHGNFGDTRLRVVDRSDGSFGTASVPAAYGYPKMVWMDGAIWQPNSIGSNANIGNRAYQIRRTNPQNWSASNKGITGDVTSFTPTAIAAHGGCLLIARDRKVYDLVWGTGVTAVASEMFELDAAITGQRIYALASYLGRLYVALGNRLSQPAFGFFDSGDENGVGPLTVTLIPVDPMTGEEVTTGGAARIAVTSPEYVGGDVSDDSSGTSWTMVFIGAGEDGDDLRLGWELFGQGNDDAATDTLATPYYRRLPGGLTWAADTEDLSGGPDSQWDLESAAGNWLDQVAAADPFPGIGQHPGSGDAILVRRLANGAQEMYQQDGTAARKWRRGPR